MKNILGAILILMCISLSHKSQAQFDYIGGGLALATGSEYLYDGYSYYNKSLGIDLRANYDYSKKIQIVPDLKFFLPNKEKFMIGGEASTTVIAFNLNAHYIINAKSRDNYRIYFLGGAHVSGWSIKDNRVALTETLDVKEFKFVPGLNVGAGMQFPLGTQLLFFAEVKYVISQANQMVFTPGILFSI